METRPLNIPKWGQEKRESPETTADGAPPSRRRLKRLVKIVVGLMAVVLIVIGPWPADNSSYVDSSYQRHSLEGLAGAAATLAGPSVLSVGVAEADITPPPGHPLAGFGARKDNAYRGIDSRCYVRALTVQSGDAAVTILTADMLLINSKLARAVTERTGLAAGQIYFTASHTHSGPGGWGEHPLERAICGAYDAAFFDRLAGTLAGVVMQSRGRLRPAEMAVVCANTSGRQRNRLDESVPNDDRLLALLFRDAEPNAGAGVRERPLVAMLVVFSAHAVCLSQHSHVLSADYPGALVSRLREKTGCPAVMFAAGAVAEASVIRSPDAPEVEQAHALGFALADDLAGVLAGARFEHEAVIANFRLPLELPALRYPVSAGWSLSPLCTNWIADRHTYVHALRIGPAFLVGFPGDYSWQLAGPLSGWCGRHGFTLITTSFNGDYKGYFVTERAFQEYRRYETRWMNFFGPWGGEYMTDVARRMLERMIRPPD